MERFDAVFFVSAFVAIIAIAGALGYLAVHHDETSDDDIPKWAEDMADGLSEGGGKISLYYTGGENLNTYTIYLTEGQDIRAEREGLVIYGDYGITQYPYERIATIVVW